MAEVTAQLNSLRLSPRKVRLVVNAVKGKNAERALEQLEFLVRRPAEPVAKLIKSALANAENNFHMVRSNLYIKEFYVDEGMKLHRYRPKAFGRANPLQKKTSHLRLTLAEKVPGLKAQKSETKKAHTHEHKHEAPAKEENKSKEAKPEIKAEIGKKGEKAATKRRLFQRKSV
ncbi:MAG TPA: 50S ribosomal protein L22 [Candidatus Paceibacterota bacterium]|nr:50S ribosomal protein L22 [Candidatus Paceibacterota bacterium]